MLLGEIAAQALNNTYRFVCALALNGDDHGGVHPTWDVVHGHEFHAGTQPGTHRYRCGEADLAGASIETSRNVLDLHHLRQEQVGERKREVTVGDGPTKRRL